VDPSLLLHLAAVEAEPAPTIDAWVWPLGRWGKRLLVAAAADAADLEAAMRDEHLWLAAMEAHAGAPSSHTADLLSWPSADRDAALRCALPWTVNSEVSTC
jgi:hypothetical protein